MRDHFIEEKEMLLLLGSNNGNPCVHIDPGTIYISHRFIVLADYMYQETIASFSLCVINIKRHLDAKCVTNI